MRVYLRKRIFISLTPNPSPKERGAKALFSERLF
jgi:hypothetical protein